MNITRRRGWEISDRLATPEHLAFSRRSLLAGVSVALAPCAAYAQRLTDVAKLPDPSAELYPAKRNEKYALDRPITDEKINGNYNNFYEFGTSKTIAAAAQALAIRPWTVKIDGMVEKPMEVGIDDLIRKLTLEERTYRHRCVEAWGMAIAWTGFPFAKLVEFARPLGSAQYVRMETFMDAKMAPGQRQPWYPWPYVEGVTMAEATNELAFLVTGAYGHPLARQHGAPLRLALPWKYGFKSIKSIVRFSFTDKRPKGMWEALQPSSTASGPTSIRRCRIRAGARRPRKSSVPASAGRRFCSMATANMSPTFTRVWKANASGRDPQPLYRRGEREYCTRRGSQLWSVSMTAQQSGIQDEGARRPVVDVRCRSWRSPGGSDRHGR